MLQIDDLEFPAFGFVEEMPGLAELELLGLVDGPELVDLVVELEHDAVELADHLLDLLLKLNVLVPTIEIEELLMTITNMITGYYIDLFREILQHILRSD